MNKDLTEIVIIMDKSGSMSSVKDDAIGGFNEFIKSQIPLPGICKISLRTFSDYISENYSNVVVSKKLLLKENDYRCDGCTALYDAIGLTINSVGERLNDTPEDERPSKVLFAILTDGAENASHEFSKDKIMEMIDHQKSKYSWDFIFLAAGPEAMKSADTLGWDKNRLINFDNTGDNQKIAYSAMAEYSTLTRSVNTMNDMNNVTLDSFYKGEKKDD